MSINNPVVIKHTETHIMGTAVIELKHGSDSVVFVAPKPEDFDPATQPTLDSTARYYSSPLVANTAFEDLSRDKTIAPAFTGRDLGTMQEHLTRQAK